MASLDEKQEHAGPETGTEMTTDARDVDRAATTVEKPISANEVAGDGADEGALADSEAASDDGADGDANDADAPVAAAPPARSLGEWLRGAPLPNAWHLGLGLVLPMLVLVFNMMRVRSFTIDDAYISYRYARNFARGLGLVYNAGERIEGYTNFLWTVLLGVGIKIGIDPNVLAKVLGGLSACGSLVALYLLSNRLRPRAAVPCLATWLFASSIVESGYAVFGLETPLFIFLVLAGTEMMFRERDRGAGLPYSGLVFGLAGLTRPEAPLFIGIPMLFLGLGFFRPQNLLRGVLFAAPIACHMLWRHSYYGSWLPNTLSAKTGSLSEQLAGGQHYLTEYAQHASPALGVGLFGLCVALMLRHRDALCLALLAIAVVGYVLLVGGDWMPYYRFLAPFEPYWFLLACLGLRTLLDPLLTDLGARAMADRQRNTVLLAVGAGLVATAGLVALGVFRARKLDTAQHRIVDDEKRFWDSAAGGAAEWLIQHNKPGEVAVGDIGYIGYATDYPLLDLLGLVDPVISKLPGGYTRKTGPGYVQHVFEKAPKYFVFVGGKDTCDKLPFPAQEKLRKDRRFRGVYQVAGKIRHAKDGYWCVFERRDDAPAAGADGELIMRPPQTTPAVQSN